MSKIVEVIRFITPDGKAFENKQEAEAHGAYLDLFDLFRKYKGDKPGGIGIAGVFDLLHEHPALFRAYLNTRDVEKEQSHGTKEN